MQVYKNATCGCCAAWVGQLRTEGFDVKVTETEQLDQIKAKYSVPTRARSCHTGVVDGYVVEGHVPVADIRRLLKERPAVLGIAVPGMPVGSPGMEVPGIKPQPYDVVTFDKTGASRTFSSHNN